MHRARDQVAVADRAKWLDELAAAIGHAQRLTWRLGVVEGDSCEARSLYARLEALLGEVETLRLSDWAGNRQEIDPEWLGHVLAEAILPVLPPA